MNESVSQTTKRVQSKVVLPDALEVLAANRPDDAIVITSMNTTYIWPQYSSHPLDFHFIPSTMGGVVPLALGFALAQPQREVIVFSGDGSLLMSLGSLVTVAAAKATNLTIVLIDNGSYEVTGGQKTAAEAAEVDFEKLAVGSGIKTVVKVASIADMHEATSQLFETPGPRLLSIVSESMTPDYLDKKPDSMDVQIKRVQTALGVAGLA